jgi:sigma-70, region 4 subfamily
MKKEYYIYDNEQKGKVSEEIYKVYWKEREHEKYLEQVDRKNYLLFFCPWIRMDILQRISLMKALMPKKLSKRR